jgi:uncharacterized protein involved in type VI secretion and phage assembly
VPDTEELAHELAAVSRDEHVDPAALRAASARLRIAEEQKERMLRQCAKCADTHDMTRYSMPGHRWLACTACKRVIPLKARY